MRRSRCNLGDIFDGLVSGGTKAVDVYLQHGGSVNVTSGSGEGLLAAAVRHGDSNLFHWCVEKGANVRHADKFRRTSLHVAAEYDDVAAMERLLQRGADVRDEDINGDTPLLVAAQKGNFSSVQFLLSSGADVNRANADGYTPLHAAVESGDQPLVSLILSYKPKVAYTITGCQRHSNHTILKPRTPLVQAMEEKKYEIVSQILQNNAQRSVRENFQGELLWMIQQEHRVAAEMLIRHGVDLNGDLLCCYSHSVMGLIMSKSSARLLHLVLEHHPQATSSDLQENCLLRCTVKPCSTVRGLSSRRHKQTLTCRLLAALLHCGMSASCLRQAASEGLFNDCECRRVIQPLTDGTLEPAPLKVACRSSIRRSLGLGLSQKIDQLFLPAYLKRYLKFEVDGLEHILNLLVPVRELSLNLWA